MNRSIYTEAFADDMYLTIFKDDPLDPERGSRFRKIVLQPGGSRGSYPLTVAMVLYTDTY
jgi:Zn-dependent oligopeptidase